MHGQVRAVGAALHADPAQHTLCAPRPHQDPDRGVCACLVRSMVSIIGDRIDSFVCALHGDRPGGTHAIARCFVSTQGDSNPFSKKDREVRAREVRESISAPLLDVVSNKASEWVGEGKPAQVVEESILHAEGAYVFANPRHPCECVDVCGQ